MLPPPAGFELKATTDHTGTPMVVIPQPTGGFIRYGIAAFLGFWLCGWSYGCFDAFREIISGSEDNKIFTVDWLGGALLAEVFVIWILYRMLRPTIPETLVLSKPGMVFDTGFTQYNPGFTQKTQMEALRNLFARRRVINFSQGEVTTLRLRETESGNRLTLDHGNQRIEIGRGLTEVEREWLYEQLRSEYALR